MAISEACGLWIEQRIQEELEANPDNPNLSLIGREIGQEIEKHFETEVRPDTIRKKASRILSRTNVQKQENTTKTEANTELEKLEKKVSHGGARKGAGRKTKAEPIDKPEPEKTAKSKKRGNYRYPAAENAPLPLALSGRYEHLYDELFYYIASQKKAGWKEESKEAIKESLNVLIRFING